jgi:glycosyltransferase involved in cell wall biosynthesis
MTRRLSILELRSVRGTGGGPEKTILLGAARRDRERFDVTVCYVRDARDDVFAMAERARRMNLDYVELPERTSFDPRLWRTLAALVRDRRADIVHAHDYKTNFLALSLARRTTVRPLSTAHGWTGQSARERWIYYPADKRLLARFPHVIAVSDDIRQELIRWRTRPNRITVLLNGIDPDTFRRQPGRRESVRARLGWASEDFVIGAVGRLEPQKRFDRLLEAFAAALASDVRLRLAIAGDGSLAAELRTRAAALGVGERVALLGHRDDIADLHHAFDLFVQSSDYEGTSNAVLEAMALETPIVATNVGGTAEIARPAVDALVVPPNDVPALTAAILDVRRDGPGASNRVRSARRRVETDLSFEVRTRRLEQIYLDLTSDPVLAGPLPVSSRVHDA